MKYRPKGFWVYVSDDEEVVKMPATETVFDEGPIDTGLLDASGRPLVRVKDPIGFKTH